MIRHSADDPRLGDPRLGYVPPGASRGRSPGPTLEDDVRVVFRSLAGLARVEALRLGSKVREGAWRVGLALWALLALAVMTIAAAMALITGVAGGLAELFGNRGWAGALATAVLFFGGMVLMIRVVRARGARKRVAKLLHTLEPVRTGPAAPAEHYHEQGSSDRSRS